MKDSSLILCATFWAPLDLISPMVMAALFVDGVAQGLAVDGKAVVGLAVNRIPVLQGTVEVLGIDPDQANDAPASVADNALHPSAKRDGRRPLPGARR